MAFSSLGGNGGGALRGRRFGGGSAPLSEINIIPLVDVVLVLLIIFMLTAHVMEYGMEVDVPKVKQEAQTTQDLPVVTLSKTGEIYLNDKPANINTLGAEVQQRFGKTDGVYVRADGGVTWDPLAQVVSALNASGFKVKMVTQPEENAGPLRR